MSMYRYGHASVVKASITADDWTNKVYNEACKDGQCRLKTAKSVIAKFSPDKYLLCHCSIIASVDTDLADPKDPKSDYLIKPEFSNFVNNNGDAWTKGVILNSYKTFIGGENFTEHIQLESMSKGKIIDAVPREIVIGKDKNGKDLSTVYIDILVATDRKHEDLIRRIESKELTTLSMGCLIKYSICSKCGNKAADETQACQHVRFQKNNMFFDDNGVQRKIAELCGSEDDMDSVKFIEASWVRQPAFTGAVLRSLVTPSEEIMAKFDEANKKGTYKKKPGDYLKAASELIAQDEPDNAGKIDPVPEDKPDEEQIEDPTSTTPEEIPAEVQQPEDDVQTMTKNIKKQLLRQISDEVSQEISDESNGPRELETLDETLIKPASLVLSKVWGAQKSWDRFIQQRIGSVNKKTYDRLRYGIHMAMTNSDLTVLKDYGYSKRDLIAVLSFLDNCLKNPLPMSVKKTIASLGGSKGNSSIELLKTVVADLGRKLTKTEASRTLSWIKLLDFYD
jgi:hypothetical protein